MSGDETNQEEHLEEEADTLGMEVWVYKVLTAHQDGLVYINIIDNFLQ